MAYIYGIIKAKGSDRLSKVSYYITESNKISNSELCKFHDYAYNLYQQYSSCFPRIHEKDLTWSEKTRRKDAVNFEHARKELMDKYGSQIVAISHRHGGWCGIDWNFNSDISFHIGTNFGFGSCSYFYAIFRFKDAILAPYSFYVKYKNSTFASVVRCTYEYQLNYDSWDIVMSDCIKFYNAIVFEEGKNYVLSWLNRQLNEMIFGLESLCDSNSASFIDECVNKSHASGYTTISGDDLWLIKFGKIANSLDFIENIKMLPMEVNSSIYTKRLLSLCKKFQPNISSKIKETESLLTSHENYLSKLEELGDYPLYIKFFDKYYFKKKWYLSSSKFKMIYFLLHVKAKIHPQMKLEEIKLRIANLKKLLSEIDEYEQNISKTKKLLNQLDKNNTKIINYFNEEGKDDIVL